MSGLSIFGAQLFALFYCGEEPLPSGFPLRNDRGFDPAAGVLDSKVTFLLDFETGERVVQVNETCCTGGQCYSPQLLSVFDPEPFGPECGTAESPPASALCLGNLPQQSPSTRNYVVINDSDDGLSIRYRASLAGPPVSTAINGELSFQPIPGSERIRLCRNRDPFPSLEAYQFVDNRTVVLGTEKELTARYTSPGLDAPFSLSPFAPNDRGCS